MSAAGAALVEQVEARWGPVVDWSEVEKLAGYGRAQVKRHLHAYMERLLPGTTWAERRRHLVEHPVSMRLGMAVLTFQLAAGSLSSPKPRYIVRAKLAEEAGT